LFLAFGIIPLITSVQCGFFGEGCTEQADKFERLFTAYAKHVGASSPDQFMFQFDGDQLPANSTPKELGMEDDDIIEVYDKSTGKH
jgi:hypothetical protein